MGEGMPIKAGPMQEVNGTNMRHALGISVL